jgi:hypothetical protein
MKDSIFLGLFKLLHTTLLKIIILIISKVGKNIKIGIVSFFGCISIKN